MEHHQMSPSMEVYLLGTGGPEYTTGRVGFSTLVAVNGSYLLFDAGRGAAQRIYECSIPLNEIQQVFLTHLHSDHIEGLANLWITPWFLLGKRTSLRLCGPVGTRDMADGMHHMFAKDFQDRANSTMKQEYLYVETQEYHGEGQVYDQNGVVVTAFPVEHGDGNPAYGFLLEANGCQIVFSGDTTYHPNVVKYGQGCTVLIHNVLGVPPEQAELYAPVLRKLTSPEQAADVFCQTRPKLAVFSHICKKGMPGETGDQEILARVRRRGYDGPLEMGYDRMKLLLWPDQVAVEAPIPLDRVPDLQ